MSSSFIYRDTIKLMACISKFALDALILLKNYPVYRTIAAVHRHCRSWVKSGQNIARQNPPLSAVPQKRTKEPPRKPPSAREMGPLFRG